MKICKPNARAARLAAALIAAPVAVLPMVLAPSASAAWIVYDPTNYAQNVLQAARALEQINNQITSLQNRACPIRPCSNFSRPWAARSLCSSRRRTSPSTSSRSTRRSSRITAISI
jgi:hypothetical protein